MASEKKPAPKELIFVCTREKCSASYPVDLQSLQDAEFTVHCDKPKCGGICMPKNLRLHKLLTIRRELTLRLEKVVRLMEAAYEED